VGAGGRRALEDQEVGVGMTRDAEARDTRADQVGGTEGRPAAPLASLPFFMMSDCLPVCAEVGRSPEVGRRRSHDLPQDDASPTVQDVRAVAHTTPRRLTNTGASCPAPEGDTRSPTRSAAEQEKGNR
jgi:hypothetical protein